MQKKGKFNNSVLSATDQVACGFQIIPLRYIGETEKTSRKHFLIPKVKY